MKMEPSTQGLHRQHIHEKNKSGIIEIKKLTILSNFITQTSNHVMRFNLSQQYVK